MHRAPQAKQLIEVHSSRQGRDGAGRDRRCLWCPMD
jgi:hypothetical protein